MVEANIYVAPSGTFILYLAAQLASLCIPPSSLGNIGLSGSPSSRTAFFTFLRANLVLAPSAMSSNVGTPLLEPASSQTLQPPSPAPLANRPTQNLDDIPPLSLGVLAGEDDKVDAFKLVADSVAQQRQSASLNLVFHPANLALLVAALAVAFQFSKLRDAGTAMMTGSGIIMTYLMIIRYFSSGYIYRAEDMKWDWVCNEDGDEDTLIGTRFGDEMVGALVLRLEPASPGLPKRKGRATNLRGGRGVIRAWTTRLRYRKRGVGTDMLHEAVRVTREKCGRDAEVGFAQEHANSHMILAEMFNGPFRKNEMRAAKALDKVLSEWDGNKRIR